MYESDMIIRILFFDTSALLKMFVNEDGSANVKWLTHPETKICNSLQFFVNDQVCLEFEKKISQFKGSGKISKKKPIKFWMLLTTITKINISPFLVQNHCFLQKKNRQAWMISAMN